MVGGELDQEGLRAAAGALDRWTFAQYEKQVFSDLPDAAEACVRAYLRAEPEHEHDWHWRRKRNAEMGFWECAVCGQCSLRIHVDAAGRPAHGPPS